jgi:UDPglucose 6-dehydrogenase
MQHVAVIGQGFVGGSLTTVLAERGIGVYTFDTAGKRAVGGKATHEDEPTTLAAFIADCGALHVSIFFVCVPTPMLETGAADTGIVESVLRELASYDGERIAVVKSTVPPGSTARWNAMFRDSGLRVIFNPEFLREASALCDMRTQSRILLGGPRPWINTVKQLFEKGWPNVPVIKTSSTNAEMVKYTTNVHLAVKVSLANELRQICVKLDEAGADVDYDKVVEYALLDPRLGSSHWKVPGPMPADDSGEPAFGFGGSCFVKDLNALMWVARECGVEPSVMAAAWQKNLEVRPQRDWEKLRGRAVK